MRRLALWLRPLSGKSRRINPFPLGGQKVKCVYILTIFSSFYRIIDIYFKKSYLRILFLVCPIVLVAACATSPLDNSVIQQPEIAVNLSPTEIETPTTLPSPVSTISQTITVLSSSTPMSISTKTLSPTVTPLPSCPKANKVEYFNLPSTIAELQASILTFINEGGQWNDLWALLDEMEIKYDAVQADMTGDGIMETAVYALLYDENHTPNHVWWIFQCTTNQYSLVYDIRGTWAFHSYFITDDLDNDDRLEIIEVGGFAGSACDLEPKVWSWQNDRIIDLSPDYLELELGCATNQQIILQDINDNGTKEMILTGETVAHIDYAPIRTITQTFALQGSGYELQSTVYAPADLRIHVLDDAQRALDGGDLPLAIQHYTQAAYEEMMTTESYQLAYPYMSGYLPDADTYQKGFALFRLFVIKLATGDEEGANSILRELNILYPENMLGHEFVILSQTFFDAFRENRSLEESCKRTTEYVSKHYEDQTQTDSPTLTSHFYWGLNIASYMTPDSFCPVFTPENVTP